MGASLGRRDVPAARHGLVTHTPSVADMPWGQTPGRGQNWRLAGVRAPLGAVALLVLLARPAGARVVAADLLADHALAGRDGGRGRGGAAGGHAGPGRLRSRLAAARRADGVGAGDRLVLVREAVAVPAVAARPGLELALLGLLLDLDPEQVADDLLLDHRRQLLEHPVALGPVLGERVLLRHGAQVDAVAQVLHRLEVLAPADVDHLEDEVALDLAQE